MKVELLLSRRRRARESSMKNENFSKFTAKIDSNIFIGKLVANL